MKLIRFVYATGFFLCSFLIGHLGLRSYVNREIAYGLFYTVASLTAFLFSMIGV